MHLPNQHLQNQCPPISQHSRFPSEFLIPMVCLPLSPSTCQPLSAPLCGPKAPHEVSVGTCGSVSLPGPDPHSPFPALLLRPQQLRASPGSWWRDRPPQPSGHMVFPAAQAAQDSPIQGSFPDLPSGLFSHSSSLHAPTTAPVPVLCRVSAGPRVALGTRDHTAKRGSLWESTFLPSPGRARGGEGCWAGSGLGEAELEDPVTFPGWHLGKARAVVVVFIPWVCWLWSCQGPFWHETTLDSSQG